LASVKSMSDRGRRHYVQSTQRPTHSPTQAMSGTCHVLCARYTDFRRGRVPIQRGNARRASKGRARRAREREGARGNQRAPGALTHASGSWGLRPDTSAPSPIAAALARRVAGALGHDHYRGMATYIELATDHAREYCADTVLVSHRPVETERCRC